MEQKLQVLDLIEELQVQLDCGTITQNLYHKLILTLAYDFLDTYEDVESCLIAINKCAPDYFLDTLPIQMANDSVFAETILSLYYFLDKNGISPEDTVFNHPSAEA